MAGINASLQIRGKDPLILGREEAYIGVLIDDLVTKGTKEPYRMFTSRAEYRLLLREDNADFRLREKGRSVGLVNDKEYSEFIQKELNLRKEFERLNKVIIQPTSNTNDQLKALGSSSLKSSVSLIELLRRPEISYYDLKVFDQACASSDPAIAEQVEIQTKYEGYIKRQEEHVGKLLKLEGIRLPANMDFKVIPGLTAEVKEKLAKIRPLSLGQASRISGVTPAAISILMIHLKRIATGKSALPPPLYPN
jgi:tRNA uridine 5-carboxymethylaminomethyl modification enzyme